MRANSANDERLERKAKEVKTVESLLGKDHLAHLLRLCGVAEEADPIWLVLPRQVG